MSSFSFFDKQGTMGLSKWGIGALSIVVVFILYSVISSRNHTRRSTYNGSARYSAKHPATHSAKHSAKRMIPTVYQEHADPETLGTPISMILPANNHSVVYSGLFHTIQPTAFTEFLSTSTMNMFIVHYNAKGYLCYPQNTQYGVTYRIAVIKHGHVQLETPIIEVRDPSQLIYTLYNLVEDHIHSATVDFIQLN